jgi:hypothetical protein
VLCWVLLWAVVVVCWPGLVLLLRLVLACWLALPRWAYKLLEALGQSLLLFRVVVLCCLALPNLLLLRL